MRNTNLRVSVTCRIIQSGCCLYSPIFTTPCVAFRESPAFAAIAIASLALGIGANGTIYSVVHEMILDDFSARHPDRLARIAAGVTYARYRDLRHAGVFQDLAFEIGIGNINWDVGQHSKVAWVMHTSASFFDVLGVAASAGRLSSQANEGLPVTVVSYGFWSRRLLRSPHRRPPAPVQP